MENMLGTNTMVQVAIVCHDIKKTAADYAKVFGVDMPNIIYTDDISVSCATYRGESTKARAYLAFIKVGELINIEIIQPDQEPSTWREHLDAHGEGMHHIAFLMKDMADMDARSALLQANGMPTVQRGLSAKGGKLNLELLVRNRKPEER